jgi:F-type H+-transporting ATPase subunit delta
MADSLSTRPSTVLEDPGARSVARVYARAYLDAAGVENAQAAMDDLTCFLRELDQTDPRFRGFFSSGLVSMEHTLGIIERVIAPRCSELLTNFLRVLTRHQRLDVLRAVQAMAQEELEKRHGERRLSLAKALAAEPIMTATVDPALLGGMVIRVGDTVYDGSLRTRIKQLRARLRERCVNEIQRGRDRFSYPEGN